MTDDLPTPPLPLADRDDPRSWRRPRWSGADCEASQAGLLHERRALVLGHLVVLDRDLADAGEAGDLRADVGPDLAPQRAAGGGERDLDHDVAVGRDPDVVDHPEVDDRGPQLGVEDPGQDAPDVVGERSGAASVAGRVGEGVGRSIVLMCRIKHSRGLENMPDCKVPSSEWTCWRS